MVLWPTRLGNGFRNPHTPGFPRQEPAFPYAWPAMTSERLPKSEVNPCKLPHFTGALVTPCRGHNRGSLSTSGFFLASRFVGPQNGLSRVAGCFIEGTAVPATEVSIHVG